MKFSDLTLLIDRFDVAVPRYTSYPTVPNWKFEHWTDDRWKDLAIQSFRNNNNELSIYIHLPFCEELCTYCACNKRITKNHQVEYPYIDAVLKEWKMYKDVLKEIPIIKEIHLGGGTPTFFSPKHLKALIDGIKAGCAVALNHEFSVEVHPNYTTHEHLKTLSDMGFNRISIGVQDFSPHVQFLINRIQSFEQTEQVVRWARELGYESVNIDLVYGLPGQNENDVVHTVERVKDLGPDRIAFYSYAHVPWKSKGQRRYTDADVPEANAKMKMYWIGRTLLLENGFFNIGMDHFAKAEDALLTAYNAGILHRNFMGYTTNKNQLVIGLGASSISDSWNAYAQNEKAIEVYQEKVNDGKLPVVDGHLLSEHDMRIRKFILDLMCNDRARIDVSLFSAEQLNNIEVKLKEFEALELIRCQENEILILEKGKIFIRNICAIFDQYLVQNSSTLFSKAI